MRLNELKLREYDGSDPVAFVYELKKQSSDRNEPKLRVWFTKVDDMTWHARCVVNQLTSVQFPQIYDVDVKMPMRNTELVFVCQNGLAAIAAAFSQEAQWKSIWMQALDMVAHE